MITVVASPRIGLRCVLLQLLLCRWWREVDRVEILRVLLQEVVPLP
eukprot:COSAG06_NODE_18931_length_861_cov_1.356955_1_plen_45_part_10